MNIQGRYSKHNDFTRTEGSWSIPELQQLLQNEHRANLELSGYYINDANEDNYEHASMLSLFPNETKIFEKDGYICITAHFREYKLPYAYRSGNDEKLVPVTCLIDPNDENLYVTITKIEKSA